MLPNLDNTDLLLQISTNARGITHVGLQQLARTWLEHTSAFVRMATDMLMKPKNVTVRDMPFIVSRNSVSRNTS